MSNKKEIQKKIEKSKTKINENVSEIGHIIHKNTDVVGAVKSHPFISIAVGAGAGLSLALISTPLGRIALKSIVIPAITAASAYYSQKGVHYLTESIKHQHK